MIRKTAFARSFLLTGAAVAALSSTIAQAAVDQYNVEGESRMTINLDICSMESQLAIRGDTSSDLDFTVNGPDGANLHQDSGVDDYLSLVIEKDDDTCETFTLGVTNLGTEANDFTVILEPVIESSTRVQKYIIGANETQTVRFKACGTSAQVSARGDGDTDLDFVIRNSDGGVVHENEDETDATSTELAGLLGDCEVFEMDVVNIGEVYNAMMLVVDPQGADETPFAGTQPTTSFAEVSLATDGAARVSRTAEGSGAGEYRADANTTLKVNLPVCGATWLEVRGDGDTDLDFRIKDEEGEEVHTDQDASDVTFVTLSPKGECETFGLEVDNLGEVFNTFTIAMIDPATRAATLGAGEYSVRGNTVTKVAMRVCRLTNVSASGEGDSDLDFVVTDDRGSSVHSNNDFTDKTQFILDPGEGCANYQMAVSNIGETQNLLTIAFGEDGASGTGEPAKQDRLPVATPSWTKSDIAPPNSVIGSRQPGVSGDGQDRRLSIQNRTGEDVREIFWSNSATLEWGYNRLMPSQRLASGGQWNVVVRDGSAACLFDFRAITANARVVDVAGVNVCETSKLDIE